MKDNEMIVHEKRAKSSTVPLVDIGDHFMIIGILRRVLPYLKDEEAFCFTFGDGLTSKRIIEFIKNI